MLLSTARTAEGLTQAAAAHRAGTSQPTLSAYERGTKAPTLPVLERILHALGYELDLTPRVTFHAHPIGDHGRTFHVPNRLWRLSATDCFVPLTVRTNPGRKAFDLSNRADRTAAYIWLLERGSPEQILGHLDGALLVDGWPDMEQNLNPEIRHKWTPVIDSTIDAWLVAQLRNQEDRPLQKPVSRHARQRAIRRLAEHGLEADEIRAALRRSGKM
ncbi:MAG TPA: helix-turn-helix transcriptional regulator [Nocardioidaceae bacterium]|nr:helix-turn-helix transcriptional regulator [Nocardioidaceae bacterium]